MCLRPEADTGTPVVLSVQLDVVRDFWKTEAKTSIELGHSPGKMSLKCFFRLKRWGVKC
jgi:hypothetical protein